MLSKLSVANPNPKKFMECLVSECFRKNIKAFKTDNESDEEIGTLINSKEAEVLAKLLSRLPTKKKRLGSTASPVADNVDQPSYDTIENRSANRVATPIVTGSDNWLSVYNIDPTIIVDFDKTLVGNNTNNAEYPVVFDLPPSSPSPQPTNDVNSFVEDNAVFVQKEQFAWFKAVISGPNTMTSSTIDHSYEPVNFFFFYSSFVISFFKD